MPVPNRSIRGDVRLSPAPALRILFYVDKGSFLGKYGTSLLQDALLRDAEQMNIQIEVKLRTEPGWLERKRLDEYHEIWFFLAKERADNKFEGPLVPLEDAEVSALRDWMAHGGGVLITGDHAAEHPEEYEGLGGHVGRRIPRAGQMRAWDDPPGTGESKVDTTDGDSPGPSDIAEADARPQRLLLPKIDGKRHPIFLDSRGRLLDRFADHRHEGEVRIPKRATIEREWPGGKAPTIIARAVDWRSGRTNKLMAAWDGHAVPTTMGAPECYGRILADSSFHHYTDHNLLRIADLGGESWDKIQEIFRNQAAWLAPTHIKKEYRDRALIGLLDHPYVKEATRASEEVLGPIVGALLAEMLPGSWFHELGDDLLKDLNAQRPKPALGVAFDPHLLAATVRRLSVDLRAMKAQPGVIGDVLLAPQLAVPMRGVYEDAVASYWVTVAARKDELVTRLQLGLQPERED